MSVFAAATGLGSWPGSTPRQAAEIVVGELHQLPHLVELPERGVGADLIGRAGALLVDIAIDTVPRGYRIAAHPGSVTRRAISLLDEDIDALEEAWEKAGGPGSQRCVKVQAPGPITLAAQLELPNGHRALTDAGAVRDLTSSLAEGVARHRVELARRLGVTVVVQYDEPVLPAALAGRLTGVTALSPVHPVDEAVAIALIDECVRAVDAEVLLHSCATELPWDVLRRSAIHALAVDPGTFTDRDLDGMGEFLDTGRAVVLGLLPAATPPRRPSADEVATAAVAITDRIGFARAGLRDRLGVSPACGLAGADAGWARVAIGLAQRAADALAQDPAAI
ncbi:methionine synthase [Mycolicibacterium sp. CBM1]